MSPAAVAGAHAAAADALVAHLPAGAWRDRVRDRALAILRVTARLAADPAGSALRWALAARFVESMHGYDARGAGPPQRFLWIEHHDDGPVATWEGRRGPDDDGWQSLSLVDGAFAPYSDPPEDSPAPWVERYNLEALAEPPGHPHAAPDE